TARRQSELDARRRVLEAFDEFTRKRAAVRRGIGAGPRLTARRGARLRQPETRPGIAERSGDRENVAGPSAAAAYRRAARHMPQQLQANGQWTAGRIAAH